MKLNLAIFTTLIITLFSCGNTSTKNKSTMTSNYNTTLMEVTTNNRDDYTKLTSTILSSMVESSSLNALPELRLGKLYFIDKFNEELTMSPYFSQDEKCLVKTSNDRYILKHKDDRIIQITLKYTIDSIKLNNGEYDCNSWRKNSITAISAKLDQHSDKIKEATISRIQERNKRILQNVSTVPSDKATHIRFDQNKLTIKNEVETTFTINQTANYSVFKESLATSTSPKELSDEEVRTIFSSIAGPKSNKIDDTENNKIALFLKFTNDIFGYDLQNYFNIDFDTNNPDVSEFHDFINKFIDMNSKND